MTKLQETVRNCISKLEQNKEKIIHRNRSGGSDFKRNQRIWFGIRRCLRNGLFVTGPKIPDCKIERGRR